MYIVFLYFFLNIYIIYIHKSALSKAATERESLIDNGNWFHKRIPLTNTDAPGQTDEKVKFKVLGERQQKDKSGG
jgi:hypothetical protein